MIVVTSSNLAPPASLDLGLEQNCRDMVKPNNYISNAIKQLRHFSCLCETTDQQMRRNNRSSSSLQFKGKVEK